MSDLRNGECATGIRSLPQNGESSGLDLQQLQPDAGVWEGQPGDPAERDRILAGTIGIKWDAGKPRMDLVPPEPLIALGELYRIGAMKYNDRNWEKGMQWGQVYAALQRHLLKWQMGEEYDPETGAHHLIAAAWNACVLYTYTMRKVGTDDRPTGTAKYSECLIAK